MWYISSSCTLNTVCQFTSCGCAHPHAVKCPLKKYSVVAWMLLLLFSLSVVSNSLLPHGLPHFKLPCPSPSPRVCSKSGLLSWWCHPTISSSVVPFSCLKSVPASGSFTVSWLFTSGGQSIGSSASASVFPMNIQGWVPSGLTDLISLQSMGLSRVFSNPTVHRQFFGTQLSLWSNSYTHTWLLEKP